jgi:hypothetical protein
VQSQLIITTYSRLIAAVGGADVSQKLCCFYLSMPPIKPSDWRNLSRHRASSCGARHGANSFAFTFVGGIAQVKLFDMDPAGSVLKEERLRALACVGGIQECDFS